MHTLEFPIVHPDVMFVIAVPNSIFIFIYCIERWSKSCFYIHEPWGGFFCHYFELFIWTELDLGNINVLISVISLIDSYKTSLTCCSSVCMLAVSITDCLFVKVRIHFITLMERSCGEMHTLCPLSHDVCVHQSQVHAGTRRIFSWTPVKVTENLLCSIWPNTAIWATQAENLLLNRF